jgi:hypothetical protein
VGVLTLVEDSLDSPNLIRSRLATHVRYRPEDTQTADELRRDYRAARLEEYVTRLLAEAPPLTDEQRERLALLFQRSTTPEVAAA